MMHATLLIDEILQLIFEAIMKDGKSSLCCAARCCQAWKGPALDRIWRRLPSAVPLLSLLPGFSIENGDIRLGPVAQDATLTIFHSYAIRVKHIVHRHRVLVDQTSFPVFLFHQLSNLESARIESKAAGEVALSMSLGPRLRALVLRVGYTKSNSTLTMHDMVSLLKGCSSLEQLSVRGYSLECLHMPLNSITTLRSLSLHLSSLTERSFMTLSTFHLLMDLDVHADRLSCDYLSSAMSARTCDTPFFPALEKLKIRAQPAVVTLILEQLPRNKLRSFHINATDCPLSALDGLFATMTSFPLHDFTLEHVTPLDESEDIPTYTSDKFFALNHLRLLSKLPLRRLILDSSLPPNVSDSDMEEMTKWWPLLERLELGSRTALENVGASWKPRTSLASLDTLAKGWPRLKSLVITLDAASLPPPGPSSAHLGSHPLTSLSISSRSRPDVSTLSAMLSRLFSSLVDLTPGHVGEHEDAWNAIQSTVLHRSSQHST